MIVCQYLGKYLLYEEQACMVYDKYIKKEPISNEAPLSIICLSFFIS